MQEAKIIHYPTLKTVIAVEEILKNAEVALSRNEIKRRLPMKIMHQTLNVILEYLKQRGLILEGSKGIFWAHNPSKKLQKLIDESVVVYDSENTTKNSY